jgi:hypothetical protein
MRPAAVEELLAATHAREHKLFAGKLDSSKLGSCEKLPVRMARGREGERLTCSHCFLPFASETF